MSLPAETTLECLVTLKGDVQRLRSHDIEAIAGLMQQYQHRVYRYLIRLVRQTSIAEDLFQQTWLRVMERIQNYDPRRSFEGWLFAIAHNLAMDHLRRRQPESLDEPVFGAETKSDRTRSSDPGALDLLLSQEREELLLETRRLLEIHGAAGREPRGNWLVLAFLGMFSLIVMFLNCLFVHWLEIPLAHRLGVSPATTWMASMGVIWLATALGAGLIARHVRQEGKII